MYLGRTLFALAVFTPLAMVFGQNVGIGTSTPLQKLHVSSSGQSSAIRVESTSDNGSSSLQFASKGQVLQSINMDGGDGGKLKFSSTGQVASTAMTLDRTGFLGIGTTQPAYHLHVSANRPGNYAGYFQNTSPTGSGLGAYSNTSHNALGGVSDHETGIGVYGVHLPDEGLGWGVWGTSNSSDGIGVRGTVPTNGNWMGYGGYFAGGLAYVNGLYNLSDARMKSNILPMQDALGRVLSLEGVTFQYNSSEFPEYVGNDNKTYLGFVAQQVETVVPEVVAEKYLIGTDGKPAMQGASGDDVTVKTVKVVDYSALVPLLVEAMKEQQAYIQSLENRLQELEGKSKE